MLPGGGHCEGPGRRLAVSLGIPGRAWQLLLGYSMASAAVVVVLDVEVMVMAGVDAVHCRCCHAKLVRGRLPRWVYSLGLIHRLKIEERRSLKKLVKGRLPRWIYSLGLIYLLKEFEEAGQRQTTSVGLGLIHRLIIGHRMKQVEVGTGRGRERLRQFMQLKDDTVAVRSDRFIPWG